MDSDSDGMCNRATKQSTKQVMKVEGLQWQISNDQLKLILKIKRWKY